MFPLTQLVISICWGIFLLYWIVSAFSLKPVQEKKWDFGKNRLIIFIIIVVAIWITSRGNHGCSLDWFGCHLDLFSKSHLPSFSIQIVSDIIVALGLIIAVIARKTLANNWSSDIDIKKNHELITTGIYGYVRHPIYTGVGLMGLGTVLFFQTVGLAVVFLLLFAFFVFKFTQEEKLLTKHFPKEYPAYKKRVKALIPFIF